jgi:phenylacetate-CoA ligase
MDETVWLEIAPLPGQNMLGEILVTHLVNYAYPMIRYRIGDLALLEAPDCSCGRGLGTIGPVKGRSHDLIVTPDGHFIHGEFFVHLFDTIGRVSRFRVIQESVRHLRIEIVCHEGLSSDHEKFLREQIGRFMGKEVAVDLQRVEMLPTERGKLRFIISNIAEAKLERGSMS